MKNGLRAIFSALLLLANAPAALAEQKPDGPSPAASEAREQGTRIILLGTAGGPSIDGQRSQPSSLLVVDGRPYLVDCGDGTLGRLAQAGFQAQDIGRVFLTHLHLDHIADIAPLVAFNWVSPGRQRIEIFGPPGSGRFIAGGLDYMAIPERLYSPIMPPHPAMKEMVAVHDIDLQQPQLVYQDDKVRVTAVENTHYVPLDGGTGNRERSYSYRFDTADRSIVFTGDTGPSESLVALAKGADVLVSEALDVTATIARLKQDFKGPVAELERLADHMRRGHLTPEEVGKIAHRAGVRQLVLNHLPPQSGNGASYIAAVRQFYSGPVLVGQDLDIIR